MEGLTLSVPIQFKRRAGRKLVTLATGNHKWPWDTAATLLQSGAGQGPAGLLESEIAKNCQAREGIDNSYVSRMVNLTTLAPDIIDAILLNELPDHLTLFDLAVDPPALWDDQRARLEVDHAACHR
jgi:hypothetical protein